MKNEDDLFLKKGECILIQALDNLSISACNSSHFSASRQCLWLFVQLLDSTWSSEFITAQNNETSLFGPLY